MMIKANEFRVGNLYLHNNTIDDFKARMIVQDREDWHPIPLTPEWLERCGFITMDYEYDVIEWACRDTELKFSITQSGIPVEQQPFTFDYDQGFGDVELEVKYVHQLQNLYFALTGEELQIKL